MADTSLSTSTKKALPKISDIYEDKGLLMKQNDLNVILNSDPMQDWVKEHPFVKGLKYLPIERVEYLLTCIFARWEVEIKETKLIANSVVVTVRLRCQDPLDPTVWIQQDGVGAMPIQVEKGKGATDFDSMKSIAIQIWAPAAESYAIKDAAEKLGKIFGKDLNRKDTMQYVDRIQTTTELMQKQVVADTLHEADTLEKLEDAWIHLRQVERNDKYIQSIYNEKKSILW